ncbi:MAG: hypothetical protein F6K39_37115 [Okeania sp. SIO3B3]|nr:hypothetical protein [Okeania sp. SIO3B3]
MLPQIARSRFGGESRTSGSEIEVRRTIPPIDYNQLLHRHCHDSKTASDKKAYPKFKPRDLPENYIWIDDMLTLMQDVPMTRGRLREEPIWR